MLTIAMRFGAPVVVQTHSLVRQQQLCSQVVVNFACPASTLHNSVERSVSLLLLASQLGVTRN